MDQSECDIATRTMIKYKSGPFNLRGNEIQTLNVQIILILNYPDPCWTHHVSLPLLISYHFPWPLDWTLSTTTNEDGSRPDQARHNHNQIVIFPLVFQTRDSNYPSCLILSQHTLTPNPVPVLMLGSPPLNLPVWLRLAPTTPRQGLVPIHCGSININPSLESCQDLPEGGDGDTGQPPPPPTHRGNIRWGYTECWMLGPAARWLYECQYERWLISIIK